jgi:DNA-binding transcriptional LysR family regulator
VLASPAYLAAHGKPTSLASLAQHRLLGFNQPDTLNRWPLRGPHGDEWPISPGMTASSGETLRQLALAGAGICCLADFMTTPDRQRGDLVEVLPRLAVDVRESVNAVYYRNTQLAARIACFLDFLAQRLADPAAQAGEGARLAVRGSC